MFVDTCAVHSGLDHLLTYLHTGSQVALCCKVDSKSLEDLSRPNKAVSKSICTYVHKKFFGFKWNLSCT